MSLFAIPPIDKRSYSHSIFNIGNIKKKEVLFDDDDYIIYRVGFIFRFLSAIAFFSIYLICLTQKKGFIDVAFEDNKVANFLEYYLHYTNYVGPALIFVLLYYFALFFYTVDFTIYNPWRHVDSQNRNQNKSKLSQVFYVLFFIVFFAFMLFAIFRPGLLTSPIFIFEKTVSYIFDNEIFVFLVAVWLVFFLPIAAQMNLIMFYVACYALFKFRSKN